MKDDAKSKHCHKNDLVLQVYNECDPILRTYAWGICRRFQLDASFADDLVQDCYYQIMQKAERIAPKYAKLGSRYLCRMLYNNLIDQWRKRQSINEQEQFFASNSATIVSIYDMCAVLQNKHFYQTLRSCLPREDYQIMKYYIEGYSYKEMGAKFDMPISTVGVRIHRAKGIIADVLQYQN